MDKYHKQKVGSSLIEGLADHCYLGKGIGSHKRKHLWTQTSIAVRSYSMNPFVPALNPRKMQLLDLLSNLFLFACNVAAKHKHPNTFKSKIFGIVSCNTAYGD